MLSASEPVTTLVFYNNTAPGAVVPLLMSNQMHSHRFCVAPMMRYTDRHARYFFRLLSRRALLYTEMISTSALLHGDAERYLRHSDCELPLALQLGGCQPLALAECVRMGADAGYTEINLNAGCPSSRTREAGIGASLFARPEHTAECVAAMVAASPLPITVKTRIGVDQRDSYEDLLYFARCCQQAGCSRLIVHARKAWSGGLSPAQNRTRPPLQQDRVYRLKQDLPQLCTVLNGGLKERSEITWALMRVDGVMLGRAAYRNPWLLASVDSEYFGEPEQALTRDQVLHAMGDYTTLQVSVGARPMDILRHLFGLYRGRPGAKTFRCRLVEFGRSPGTGAAALQGLVPDPGSAAWQA